MSLTDTSPATVAGLPRLITLRDAAPDALARADMLWGHAPGHAPLGGGHVVSRATRVALHGPDDEATRLSTLAALYADPSFTSEPVLAARLKDVIIELAYGVAVLPDGAVAAESASVARLMDPSLSILEGLRNRFAAAEAFGAPLLHVFHRSSGAYGHFVFDALVTLQAFLPAIRERRLHVLVPPYVPRWALAAMQAMGIPPHAVHMPGGEAIRCAEVVIPSSIRGWTSFLPDPDRCRALRDHLMARLRPAAPHRRIYLSRANQASYSQRSIVNEAELAAMLTLRGFETLEPGNMPFVDQVRAFAEAEVIIGAHGSAFGNLVFTRPGATVVDLMPADWVGYWNSDPPPERWLLNVTSAMGLDYDLVLCRSRLARVLPEDDTSGLQKMGMESEVDLDLLRRVMDEVEERRNAAPRSREGDMDMGGMEPNGADTALDALCDPRLEPIFRQPDRRGTNSAWWGHVPFAAWLVGAARPRSIVELGSFAGVSYFAFCQAVIAEGLECRCHAVDTWQGDAHAGQYDDSIHDDFKRHHDAKYAAISQMHRCTFDEALASFPDGSVDILHIDGLHTYDAVRHDFETWLPKLSDRGVVLFHDANERMADFGVWRFWEEVSARWPGFLFLHSHGLGVLCVGAQAPAAVRALCSADPERAHLLRDRFATIGDRWYAQAQWDVARQALEAERAARALAEQRADTLERSTSWRVTAPLRRAGNVFPGAARLLRRGARLLWWTVTLQLRARLTDRRAARNSTTRL
ncbi:class I SAM-dependent methyltransferase [Roseomonas sp. HF4]|uniref:class I SAM-dependent methyltransferase n=1 Tax=Roseomonas sp. HF4 TaxID=2562313 RepID=UPI0010BFD854|nr:class I SAM-dependent methyltransferase [Roseomonas sp. HF4]